MIDTKHLWERDSGICHLCGKHVPLDKPLNHKYAASRDHLVPRANGGEDDDTNIKLAHRICNSMRMHLSVEQGMRRAKNPRNLKGRKLTMWLEAQERRQRRDAILRVVQGVA